MKEWNNEKRISEEEKKEYMKLLGNIIEDFVHDFGVIIEDFDDSLKEFKEDKDDLRNEFDGEIKDLIKEQKELIQEGTILEDDWEHWNKEIKNQIDAYKGKLERLNQKAKKLVKIYIEKAKKRMDKAEKKAAKRINISVEPDMSDDWKDWAEDLGTSVSDLVRKSMEFVKDNIGDLKKLEKMGEYFDKMGGDIERTIKESGIENLGEKIKAKITLDTDSHFKNNKETIKKRIQGIIKLHKAIPLDKLALAMNKKVEDAEKLIYELAGEGLDGTLEEGIFKYTGDIDDVIARFDKKVDEL